MTNFEQALRFTLDREGEEFVSHPADRGGPTKFGITLRTLAAFRQASVTADDVRALSEAEAVRVYAALYWNVARLERVREASTALILFDFAVTSGPQEAIQLLQHVLNDSFGESLEVDGVFGNSTHAAVCTADDRKLNRKLIQGIQIHYARVCVLSAKQLVFLEGWLRRSFLLSDAISN